MIRLRYQRIKEKIKSTRQDYRHTVNKGTRRGSGTAVQDNYDLFNNIWEESPSRTSAGTSYDLEYEGSEGMFIPRELILSQGGQGLVVRKPISANLGLNFANLRLTFNWGLDCVSQTQISVNLGLNRGFTNRGIKFHVNKQNGGLIACVSRSEQERKAIPAARNVSWQLY